MNEPQYNLRRATVDDLPGLKVLWERARLQVLDLEKRLTDFQLVVSDAGDLIGAIGLHIEGKQGQVHSEAFAQPELDAQLVAEAIAQVRAERMKDQAQHPWRRAWSRRQQRAAGGESVRQSARVSSA